MKNNSIKILEIQQIKPIVHKKYLLLISGIFWTGIGIFLSALAYKWLLNFNIFFYAVIGIFLAIIIHTFGFSKIAKKNSDRILNIRRNTISIFAFQPLKSYGIIIIMMALGFYLRHSFIPKNYLSIIYLAIGGALVLSSFRYYITYFKHFFYSIK